MAMQLLLVQDVDHLGKKGDVVNVKPGYFRNFLSPKRLAVVADVHTLKMRARLQEERAQQAVKDKSEADQFAARIQGQVFSIDVKVDPEGHMYGSVSSTDIVKLLEQNGYAVERKNVALAHAIKAVGEHQITLKLKEGVTATFTLNIKTEE